MLLLDLRRAEAAPEAAATFDAFVPNVPSQFSPLLWPTRDLQATILRLSPGELQQTAAQPFDPVVRPHRTVIIRGEIFTTGTSLVLLELAVNPNDWRLVRTPEGIRQERTNIAPTLWLRFLTAEPNWEPLEHFERLVNEAFGVVLERYRLPNERFQELKAEGRASPPPVSEAELRRARLLADRATRTLAIAIKSSGGLLVGDLGRQLPDAERPRLSTRQDALLREELVCREVVVVCKKTQQQTARVPSLDALRDVDERGLRCACGRRITDERVEEALTITDAGRTLLDGSRWFSHLMVEQLLRLGIDRESILLEQQEGGDEIDCLANIGGELTLFELKDKEFSLGNAYSFGAKIGINRPQHSVVVTSETVGNDAKEHFQRAEAGERTQRRRYDFEIYGAVSPTPWGIRYIEGLNNFEKGIEDLVSAVYRDGAVELIRGIMAGTAPSSENILRAVRPAEATRLVPDGMEEVGISVSGVDAGASVAKATTPNE